MKYIYIADIRGNVINGKISGHIVPVARNYMSILCHEYNIKIAAGPAILNSFSKDVCLVLPYNVSSDSFLAKLKTFVNFIILLWKSKGSPVIIQHSTVVTTLLAVVLFYWWTSPLYMIQYNTEALNSRCKRFINKLAQLKLSGTLCPTERIGKSYGGRYCVVPDYFYINKHQILLPYEDRKWDVGIIGGITVNKGTIEAAEYLSKTSLKVLIAGRICEDGLEEPLNKIVSSCSNIDLRIGFLCSKDYQRYIQESKYCLLNYRGTYYDRSSGVVLDALYNGTPVIGTRCEALNVVDEKNLGILYDDINELDLEKCFKKENYNIYIENIDNYLNQQLQCKDKLLSFIKWE